MSRRPRTDGWAEIGLAMRASLRGFDDPIHWS
jgi:hypothetical protein